MKIALVHEFLNQLGGAERVLQNFLEIWPEAEIHVILYNKEKTRGEFENYKKKISLLNNFPLAQTHPRLLLVFMPKAVETFDFKDYDVVLSDSSSFAKGAMAKDKLHICYCHTPTRFLWTEPEYLNYQRYPGILKFFGKMFMPGLKRWDYEAAQRPDFFIANSANVQSRIQKFYNRDSVVIPPPIDAEFFRPTGEKKDYFFTASRLEPYKKVDLIIEAFNQLGLPLKIAGAGTIANKLKATAKPNIEFVGRVSDEELRKHYAEAQAFIFAAEEDAGITILEAQACGTPVIAYRAGGAFETVKEGITGEFFGQQTSASLIEALKKFTPAHYDGQKIRQHAMQFDKKVFQQKIKQFVEDKFKNYKPPR
jgi:glycosyltransferase involved in cell wall biosynthesis